MNIELVEPRHAFLDIDGEQVAIADLEAAYKAESERDKLREGESKKRSMAVKALREENGGMIVGGPLLLFGDPDHKDLGEDYFTPETELWLKRYPSVPALFHHGLDDMVGLSVMGHRVKAEVRDDGVWVEDWLDTSNKFWRLVKPLLDAEALYYSPGSAAHLVKREDDGKLKSFPVVEDTLTPTPMQHRLVPVEQVRAAYKSAGLELPDELPEADDGGDDAGASCQDELEVARAKAEIDILLTEIDMEV